MVEEISREPENSNFSRSVETSVTPIQMAVIVVVMTPIVCIYPFMQKYFVKGVLVGSIKG